MKDIINSIDRALDILMLLYYEQNELGVTEISKAIDISKSTVHRTLATLENKGFVQQNPSNGKYWLGIKLYALGTLAGEKMFFKNAIKPYIKELSKKFNEVVNVSILDNSNEGLPKTILILREEPKNKRFKLNPRIGSSSVVYNSAVGKCLLAFSPNTKELLEPYRGSKLNMYTKNTIRSVDELLEHLKVVKREGYSIDDEEAEIGLTCIAAPIMDTRNQDAIAAISLSGLTSKMNDIGLEKIIEEVKETADRISSILS
ncbi:IclR family transcriptional regulator [Tepidibacter hydrothermalis]|uniref:IclR family transcriptional regulator n=1 Tax=Tepidibacter hydrothermalis TaxID=3036126 RepID=A0ABY8ECH3_9FIRM|nr:IclR family transcriptional regulator [Tepidibacter hydrothermalis]WFD10613.1 IclR family transcriptional regulator [Tepidibacter hydrothermalis]